MEHHFQRNSEGFSIFEWLPWSLTLAFAYHKRLPMCEPSQNEQDKIGLSSDLTPCSTSFPDDSPVYDFVPDDGSGQCGPACRVAAVALDAYVSYLHRLSPLRTAVTNSLIKAQCLSEVSLAREAAALAVELPALIRGLRASANALRVECVAPERHHQQQEQHARSASSDDSDPFAGLEQVGLVAVMQGEVVTRVPIVVTTRSHLLRRVIVWVLLLVSVCTACSVWWLRRARSTTQSSGGRRFQDEFKPVVEAPTFPPW